MVGQTESAGEYKQPVTKQWKCKNHMLEAINDMQNLQVNGSKDSQYNDFIMFEDHFENWDKQAIILTQWDWNRTSSEPYIYVTPIGVYTDIGVFARKLQRILSEFEDISVIMMGSDLHITGYPEKDNYDKNTSFEAKFLHIDQIEDDFHHEGWKFDLVPEPKPKKKK